MLSQAQKDFYTDNGYILLKNVFHKEQIEECSKEYDELFRLKNEANFHLEATWAGDWEKDSEKQSMSVQSIHNLQCHSAIFTKMLLNDKLLDAVSGAVGSDNILLHHTKAHLKPKENGAPFPTHQDYPYFPYKNNSLVAVFVHLDASDPKNGGLVVFPGSHKLGPLEDKSNISTNHYVDQNEFSLDKGVPVIAEKGDVLIFSYLLVHGSFPNVSDRIRRMFLIQLMSAEDEPIEQVRRSPCVGMVLRGKNLKREADVRKRFEQ